MHFKPRVEILEIKITHGSQTYIWEDIRLDK